MGYEFYKVTDEICDRLELSGMDQQARKIRDAVAAGSTGTEILMALRFHFGALIEMERNLDPDLSARIKELLGQIDAVLK